MYYAEIFRNIVNIQKSLFKNRELPKKLKIMKKKLISIVISAFNEEKNIFPLMEALQKLQLPKYDLEYIFVNDGSSDDTDKEILALTKKNKNVKLISFSRNFGHEIAMTAGMDAASGDAVIFMDADLQHPPEKIPEFIEKWEKGPKIILGKRVSNEQHNMIYSTITHFYYWLLNYLTEFDTTRNYPDFRLIDRHYIDILKEFKEHSRMFRGFVYWMGAKNDLDVVEFEAPARVAGVSKYFFKDLLGLGLDAIFAFSLKPMKLALLFSGVGLLFAFGMVFYLYVPYLMEGIKVPGFLSVIFSVLIMGSAQLFILAVFAEYIGRIHFEVKKRPLYVISKKENFK